MRAECRWTAALLVLVAAGCGSCDCGSPEAAGGRDEGAVDRTDDAGRPDVPVEDRADDDADARDGDAATDREEDGADAEDSRDVRDLPDWGDCGRDVPVWERYLGEEWCNDPPTRDLNPLRYEPSPGCEQVTFSGGTIDMYDGYDVWGERVVHIAPVSAPAPGIVMVDTDTWVERVVIPYEPGSTEPHLHPHKYVVGPGGVAADAGSRYTPAAGAYVIYCDSAVVRCRLVHADPEPGTGGRTEGYYWLSDMFGSLLLAQRSEGPPDTNLRTIDVDTLEHLAVTDFPGGFIIPNAQMWGDLVVFDAGFGISRVYLSDPERAGDWLAPYPAPQRDPAIHEGRVCWRDLRGVDDDPSTDFWRGDIYCIDVDTGEVWNASRDPETPKKPKRDPTVFGDWVAWEVGNIIPDVLSADIRLYNRRLDRQWYLADRAEGLRAFDIRQSPRLWEPYIYFLMVLSMDPPEEQVFRCRLPDLFPEAYE